ncbi:enzymatic polyprotein, putative [Rhizophagus irregularis DAOM 181602=DAOM 197198]|nr:enzymatic polyprotein, putative [Rhizophagus irregularis DAOM 181602=DAOM 197198]
MEWYHVWNAEYINHKQKHDLGVIEPEECLACEICNPIEREVSAAFKKFWDALFKFEDTILMYNNVTHKELLNLLSMDNREREDTIHKGKCRNIVDRIIESIRYRQQPKMKEKGLRIIIVVIVRDCIEGNLENEVFDRLIGCPEIMEHGYILEDWDVENRFQKFWEWYNTILENDTKAKYVVTDAIIQFRKLLYMEERIVELGEDEIVYLITSIEYEEPRLSIKEQNQRLDRYIQKIVQRFIDTKQFTREPEDPESDSPESYELEDSDGSIHYEIKIEDDVEWTVESLKRKIEEMGGRFTDKNIQRMWDLRIRIELILTEDFLGTFFELMRLSDEKLKDEINEWLTKETLICGNCRNRKLPDMIADIGQCKNCEQKELLELKDDLEKLGYELNVSEIERMRKFRISNSIILTMEFMEKYFQEIDTNDEELRIKLYEWINENTTFCDECGIRWMNNKFNEGKTKCRDCENDENEIDIRVKRLKQICDDNKIEITNGELLRLISMGYTDGEILDQEFIEIFQGNKNEMEKNLRRILDKFLKQQAGIEDSESSGNESDNEKSDGSEKESDGSEKNGEILNPNDTDNNENFEEPYEENIINRPGFDSSESSESNSEDKSEISDYNIENLFETPLTPPIPPIPPIVPIIMGATRAEVREDFRAALLAATGHDIGGNWAGLVAANPLANAIEDAGNVAGGIISMPQFYGREEEDINDWVRQFETAFTAIGKAAGVNGARQAAMAATCLKGAAAQWYNEKKEANNGHLVNWQDNDNDNDLKHRIKQRFTREDVRKRKMLELRKITQGVNENVEAYTIRFRQILRIATRGHALDDELQVDNYIEGLTPTLGYQVRRQNPANLNDAVNTARREEEATNELIRKTRGISVSTQRKGIDIQDDKPKNIFEKPLEKNYEDDLADMFKKLEVKLVNQLGGQKRPPNNNNKQGPPPRACYNCKQPGHYANECRVNNGQRNYGRPNNQNYNRRSNNYNGRPNNYNRQPNYQNNNRGFNTMEFDNYNDYNDQYDYDGQDYQDDYDQEYNYGDPYYQNNDVVFNNVDQDFYTIPRQTRSNIKNRSSDRDIDMEIDREQARRRDDKYASQQDKAAALPKRGFTSESLRKAQETKRNNNTCGNCGQKGHYASECKNERVEGIHRTSAFQRNTPKYNVLQDMKNTRANATFSQIIDISPEQRKIYYDELKDVMFDTGAAVNVITSQIMDEMDLRIEEPSTVRCVMINEDKVASRGTTTIYIQFGDKEIPIKVEVIDSGKNEIVLGNGVLDMFKANIDYTDKTIILKMDNETMDVPVKYIQKTIKGFEETLIEDELLDELYQDELYNIYEDDYENYENENFKHKNDHEKFTEKFKVGDITNEQKGKLKVLVEKYKDIFEYDGEKYNRTNLVKHEIRLKEGTEPIAQKRYKENDEKGKFIRKEVDEMLKLGKIRESRSPWSSPVTLAGKKSGNYRFCIDYRKLNKVTITDAYPLPRIDEQLERISSGKWFTSLDLASGFNQIEMAEEDIEKTAFICSAGLYEYNVMPFGLTNAPANHLKHIKLVLEKLKEASLILKLKKCIFGKTEIEFLGHVVGKNGLKPSPGKVEKIQKLTAPINIKGVRSILGLCTYYRKFIKDFSKIVKPITSLLRKDEKFEWGIKQHEALEILKRKLTEEPVLRQPDWLRKFILITDASGIGLGAVLAQKDDKGQEYVIEYASKSLNRTEQRWPITEQECYAIVWGIQHFHKYLINRKFEVVTDHAALKGLMTAKVPKGKRSRWVMELEQYDFEITHRPGKENKNADALSRII